MSQIEQIADLLARSESALFVTGAGVSADSGLPTYRGIGGLYEDAVVEEGLAIEDALSGEMFRRDPSLSWKYIHQVEQACRGARHNRAHEVIAELEKTMPRVWVLTQNVDGLHQRAGSQKVIPVHGNVHDLRCTQCPWRATVKDFSELSAIPPDCPQCAGVVRPDVVLFGEMLPGAAIDDLGRELGRGFDVVFSVGTSSLFPYISEPVIAASRRGLPTVEINPGTTDVSPFVTHHVRDRAAPALAAIWDAYARRKRL